MSSRKTTAIIIALLALSCHEASKPDSTAIYDTHLEILQGKVKELREMDRESKGSPSDTNIADFDINGNIIRTKHTGSWNSLVKCTYQYNDQGKKITATAKDSLKMPHSYMTFGKYDRSGRIIEVNSNSETPEEDPDTSMQYKWLYKYDAAGNRVQEDQYYEQEHKYRTMYKYDDKHLLIEEEYFYGDGKKPTMKTSYRYTSFDSKGNWLRRVGEVKDYGPSAQEIPQPVVVRKITYY